MPQRMLTHRSVTPCCCRIRHYDIISNAREGPWKIDPNGQKQVESQVRFHWVVGSMGYDDDDVEDEGDAPPREGAEVPVLGGFDLRVPEGRLHRVVERFDDDRNLGDGHVGNNDDVAGEVHDRKH